MLTAAALSSILESSRNLHASGSMSPAALIGLAERLRSRTVYRSAETGTGASTLIFSHLSEQHTVFTVNGDASMTAVQQHPALHAGSTEFVEGPTQRTLPGFAFERLQAVLIDGSARVSVS